MIWFVFFLFLFKIFYDFSEQLWTAPELLRDPNRPKAGTQKGDIYSFAIIVNEIIVRKGTFYLGEHCDMSIKGKFWKLRFMFHVEIKAWDVLSYITLTIYFRLVFNF